MKPKLIDILNEYFRSRKTQFEKIQFENLDELLEAGVIKEINSELFELNTESTLFNSLLLEISEERLSRKLPLNISNAIKFTNEFNEQLRKEFDTKIINAYDSIIKPFKKYILIKLHNENNLDLTEFLYNLPEDRHGEFSHLFSFERNYFDVLPFINIELSKIYQVIRDYYKKEDHKYYLYSFCKDLAKNNIQLAKDLYEYGKTNGLENYGDLQSLLLVGFYNQGDDLGINEARILFKGNQRSTISFFGMISYRNLSDLKESLCFFDEATKDDKTILLELAHLITNIFKSPLVIEEIANNCFQHFYELFEIEDENTQLSIINSLSWIINGFEKERYDFLHYILRKKKKFKILEEYFSTFKDPKYFFHFFTDIYRVSLFRTNLDVFKDGLMHFWNEAKEETEKYLLELISQANPHFRLGGLRLILSSFSGIYDINLLKLNSEVKQLRAIETLTIFPYSINEILPILLKLRKSSYPNVVIFLQHNLATLVFEAYHDYLFELISKNIEHSKEDELFVKPIKETLEFFHQIRKFKNSINDLDPRENERNLIDLYYRLEHENHAIMMNEAGKGSFLTHISKSTIIVRGNSWKSEGNDEIAVLSKIESSMVIDRRAFINPDLFEMNLNNPQKNF